MRLHNILIPALALTIALPSAATYSESFTIPAASTAERRGAIMPYVRFDSEAATLGGGAQLKTCTNLDPYNIATQASGRSYIALPSSGAYARWTVDRQADGVTMRFTMPDASSGMGLDGALDVYVNDVYDQTVTLSSYYMYQYFSFGSGNPSDTPNGSVPAFAFDEVHFRLNKALKSGDVIKIVHPGKDSHAYGVDFIEIEKIPREIARPDDCISVTDFGAVANDGKDDYNAFAQAMARASQQGKTLYIPAGTFHLSKMWHVYGRGIKVTGAGIWYTNLKFTNPNQSGGGISGGSGKDVCDCLNMEICHFYINSHLRSRYNENAVYKCFMDVFSDGTVIHDIWEDHFECGFWLGDYHGSMEYSDDLKIINCRIRNNLADGVNFCQGTSHAAVYNCSVRNCGDDGLAMWNNNAFNAKDLTDNTFAYNTIELIWRAGAIAIYGGNDHKIYNNYIADTFMASGIHLNTNFPGYKFDKTTSITFTNNTIVSSGTDKDCWNEDLAAIDLRGEVRNITFTNTDIINSPVYAIRLLSGPTAIKFSNTRILGSGLAKKDVDYSCVRHSACAIRLQPQGIQFNTTTIANVERDRFGNNTTWPVWTDNNKQLAATIGYTYSNDTYTVTTPPTPGTIDTDGIHNTTPGQGGGGGDDPVQPVHGFDLTVTDITSDPAEPCHGDKVIFSATIANIGDTPVPSGTIIGAQFQIDGSTAVITWSDNYTGGIPAGGTVTITATGGTNGTNYWTARQGSHTVTCWVDDVNRFPREADKTNNTLTLPLEVHPQGWSGIIAPIDNPDPHSAPTVEIYDLQGRLMKGTDLPAGIYILRTPTTTKKITIK